MVQQLIDPEGVFDTKIGICIIVPANLVLGVGQIHLHMGHLNGVHIFLMPSLRSSRWCRALMLEPGVFQSLPPGTDLQLRETHMINLLRVAGNNIIDCFP